MVQTKTLPDAITQVSFFQLAAQQRKWTLQADQREAMKVATKAATAEKTRKIQSWLAQQSKEPTDALPPDGISVSDVAMEMMREKVKAELKEVVADELEGAWQSVKDEVGSQVGAALWCVLPCVVVPLAVGAAVTVKILRM